MGEGPPTSEVGQQIAEHREPADRHGEATGRDRLVSIVEAALLAVVALLAAWSGYASAKWSTESRVLLSRAATARVEANRAAGAAQELRNFDSSTFEAWFTAYTAGNQPAMDLAVRRFRPEFRVAFDAWLATHPESNDAAPPGPTYMPEYAQPELEHSRQLDARADTLFEAGVKAGTTADDYVRITLFLATVLFLVGISGHFRVRGARYGLIATGGVIVFLAISALLVAPKPPF